MKPMMLEAIDQLSYHYRWQQRKLAQGLCSICWREPLGYGSVSRCIKCLLRERARYVPRQRHKQGRPRLGPTLVEPEP